MSVARYSDFVEPTVTMAGTMVRLDRRFDGGRFDGGRYGERSI
jgi:hypothetical protein